MKRNWGIKVFERALLITLVIAGFGRAVFHLWNWLIPSIFGLPPISFWQAVGLLALSWILFGGWRGGWGCRQQWSHRMGARWEQMTPEEREKFRAGMQSRCGRSGTRTREPES